MSNDLWKILGGIALAAAVPFAAPAILGAAGLGAAGAGAAGAGTLGAAGLSAGESALAGSGALGAGSVGTGMLSAATPAFSMGTQAAAPSLMSNLLGGIKNFSAGSNMGLGDALDAANDGQWGKVAGYAAGKMGMGAPPPPMGETKMPDIYNNYPQGGMAQRISPLARLYQRYGGQY